MGMIGMELKISDLNPIRWVQTDRIDYNYATSGFRDTLYSVNSNAFKYVQKYALKDVVRTQLCAYGHVDETFIPTCEIRSVNDETIDIISVVEKTGTFNNGDLKVWEFEHALTMSGMFYFYLKIQHQDQPGSGEVLYFVSEPILVDSSYNCLPKIIYRDSYNYPQYDMYFATGIKFQLRLEIGANLFPHVDLVNYSDNVQNFATLHKTFYDKMDIFTTSVVPVWLARKFKFALAFDYCYVNYEPVSLVSDDDIEVIEDGLNACTFKFKTQPNTALLSITAKNIRLEPSGEEYKDFTNICMDISDYTASCGCPAPAPTEYGLCLWEPADGANQIRPINNKNIIVKNAIFSESISFSQVISEINSSGLITNMQTNLIINGYTTPILKGITTGISGKIILLTNTTNTAITIKNLEPTLSTERIETGTGSDYVMKDKESIWACWSINGYWMLINAHKELSWLDSGHTGTPNKNAGFGASGEAVEYIRDSFATSSSTSGTITLVENQSLTLTTTLTNSHTLTITPTVPTTFDPPRWEELLFTVGATLPSITWTEPSGVTFEYADKAFSVAFTANKKVMIWYQWISSTRCIIHRKEW